MKLTPRKLEVLGYRMVKISWSQLQPFFYDITVRQTDGRAIAYNAISIYVVARWKWQQLANTRWKSVGRFDGVAGDDKAMDSDDRPPTTSTTRTTRTLLPEVVELSSAVDSELNLDSDGDDWLENLLKYDDETSLDDTSWPLHRDVCPQ